MKQFRRNIVRFDGYTFDSPEECKRYEMLKELESNKIISNLKIKPVTYLTEKHTEKSLNIIWKNGKLPTVKFILDFYYVKDNIEYFEDVKGKITLKNKNFTVKPEWKIKLLFFYEKYIIEERKKGRNIEFNIFFFDSYTNKEKRLDIIRWQSQNS